MVSILYLQGGRRHGRLLRFYPDLFCRPAEMPFRHLTYSWYSKLPARELPLQFANCAFRMWPSYRGRRDAEGTSFWQRI